jgi:hypothetical protein
VLNPTPIERVRAAVADYLATPESYPLIVPVRDDRMQDQLNRQHAKQERRKYTGEPVTAMGDLA